MTDPNKTKPAKPTLNDKPVLSHKTLGDINAGYFGAAVDAELRRIINDCDAKPGLDKPRRLTIVVDVTPLARPSTDEGAYGLVVTGAVSSKLPAFKADPSVLDLTRKEVRGVEVLTAHFASARKDPDLFAGDDSNGGE